MDPKWNCFTYDGGAFYRPEVPRIEGFRRVARKQPDVVGRINNTAMVGPAISRLGRKWPSFSDYLEEMKNSPYLQGKWLPEMESYHRADVVEKTDGGGYTTNSSLEHINASLQGVLANGIDWLEYVGRITQPGILINALENYTFEAPILPKALAEETVGRMKVCQYITVPGNHITMLYGAGAREIAKAINDFSCD